MLRREFNLAVCLLALMPHAAQAATGPRGPQYWLAKRGKARVFLLGFGEGRAGDASWFTPALQKAFHESAELWLEVAPPQAAEDPAAKAKAEAEYDQLSHEPEGRTFFDELEPRVRERTLAFMDKWGVKRESVEKLRPWWAYYTLNRAFWSQTKLPYESINIDQELLKRAKEAGKPVHYEMPDGVAFARFMAGMPEKAQGQYIDWLLDFFEDVQKGHNKATFDWEIGKPNGYRSLNRMRSKMPDLYQSIQVQRNAWWAHKIGELLATDETYFIGIGQLHVLGPDSIPNQLKRLGVAKPSDLRRYPV